MESIDVKVIYYDDVHMRLKADQDILKIISDNFKFRIPNAHFHPKVKLKIWDGYIRLVNTFTGLMYVGLLEELKQFCNEENYTIDIDRQLEYNSSHTREKLKDWSLKIGLPEDRKPHDFQLDSLAHILEKRRGLIISPTGSGKSLIAYLMTKYLKLKTLIIVPAIHLATQLQQDFIDYGCDENHIHLVYQGQEKSSDCPITISTWQSIYTQKEKYFEQYDLIIADEVHEFASKEIVNMMEKTKSTGYKVGMTGTLDGSQTNEMVLTGLFGPKFVTTTTKELIDNGVLTKPFIYVISLNHIDNDVKLPKNASYQDEVGYICKNAKRNKYITNMVKSLKGNTLVLFNYVDMHGKVLYNMALDAAEDQSKIHLIYGKVDKEDREKIRHIIETSDNNKLFASYKTLQRGVNQPRLHNLVLASPSKSYIRIVQSIGRGLRRHSTKDIFMIYDFADNFKYGNAHMLERLAIYENQEFDYKIIRIKL